MSGLNGTLSVVDAREYRTFKPGSPFVSSDMGARATSQINALDAVSPGYRGRYDTRAALLCRPGELLDPGDEPDDLLGRHEGRFERFERFQVRWIQDPSPLSLVARWRSGELAGVIVGYGLSNRKAVWARHDVGVIATGPNWEFLELGVPQRCYAGWLLTGGEAELWALKQLLHPPR